MIKTKEILFCLVSILFLFTCCTKEEPGPSGGLKDTVWIPVHAKGKFDTVGYTIEWDDDLKPDGTLMIVYERDGVETEFPMTFPAYKFYHEKRENLYMTFRVSSEYEKPISKKYYFIQNGKLYLEKSSHDGYSSSSAPQGLKPIGRYEEYVIENFTKDYITFGGVTYKRDSRK